MREELYNPRSRAAPPNSFHTNLAMLALLILAIASTVLAHEGHNGSDLLKIFFVKCEIFFVIYFVFDRRSRHRVDHHRGALRVVRQPRYKIRNKPMQSWNIKLITSGLRRARDLQVGGRGAQRGDGGEQGRLRQLLRAREHAGGRGGQGRHHLQGEAGGHLLLRLRGQYHTIT